MQCQARSQSIMHHHDMGYHDFDYRYNGQPEQPVFISDQFSDAEIVNAQERAEAEHYKKYNYNYQINPKAVKNLKSLGVDVDGKDISRCEGDYLQQYLHKHLLYSLCKAGAVRQEDSAAYNLLKQAIELNAVGRNLNKQHQVAQAVSAKMACDAIIDYVKIIADIGLASAEGAGNGFKNFFSTLGFVGKHALDAATFPQETAEKLYDAFDNAVLAVSLVIAEQRCTQVVTEFVKNKVKDFYALPARDKVKVVSQFLTETALFNKLGGMLVKAAKAAPIVAEATTVKKILANPHKALAQEILDVAAETFDKDPGLVKNAIKLVQEDTKFLGIKKIENSISEQIITRIDDQVICAGEPVGRSGNVLNIVAKNRPTVINGVKFTGHALDQMQSRGIISPTAVIDVIKSTKGIVGNTPNTLVFIRENLKVVTNLNGDIVTVIWQ